MQRDDGLGKNKGAPMAGILAGIRVVELGQVLAGPFAGAIFADLGADVIKIEKPDGGDDGRQMGPAFRDGAALIFHEFNRGKRSVTLDLRSPDGLTQLNGLLARADNLRAGVAEQLGIGAEETCRAHPRLIYCSMSAFGHEGPLRMRPGYEPLLQAFCGLFSITGERDGPPVRMGASVVDQGTGLWTVVGALAMLHRRHATGRGGVLNTSLFETAFLWAGQRIDDYVNRGVVPARDASGHPAFVPYQAFDTADGPLMVCCGNDRLFAKLAAVLGRPEWSADPRFATNRARINNKDALVPTVAEALLRAPRGSWLDRLTAAGVPCAPINTIPELLAEPQSAAVGMLQAVPGEDFKLVGMPLSFDGERPAIARPAPRLGEHNGELLDEEAAAVRLREA
jgi:formyl-CoA transferase